MYISELTEVTSSITTYTMTGILWNIDLSNKFLWIALMLAAKITHKVIPYLAKLMTDTEYIFKQEDSNGNNCFTLACWNITALDELLKISSVKNVAASFSCPGGLRPIVFVRSENVPEEENQTIAGINIDFEYLKTMEINVLSIISSAISGFTAS